MKTNVTSAICKITGGKPEGTTSHHLNDDLNRVTADSSLQAEVKS